MEWYHWTFIVLALVSGLALSFSIGKLIPNSEAMPWHRRLQKSQRYWILAVAPCHSPEVSKEECAIVQDENLLYNPFLVFLPSKEERQIKPGDLVQRSWYNCKLVLSVVDQS